MPHLAPVLQKPNLHRPFNCRVYERQECQLTTTCQPAAAFGREETQWSGTIRDISVGGLRLSIGRRFEPGTGLAVELDQDRDDKRTVLVKVVHVKRQLDGMWSLGCKFISELSDEEIQRLVAGNDEVANKQTEPALDMTTVIPQRSVEDVFFQLKCGSATLLECFLKRMRVPGAWPLPEGKVVTIAGGNSAETHWRLQLQVLQCSHRGEGWLFQARLLNPPSAAHLLQAIGRLARG
jgi:hypothetical protein